MLLGLCLVQAQRAASCYKHALWDRGSRCLAGASVLLGSNPEGAAVNFAVRSRAATAMSLCLARNQPGGKTGYLEVSLRGCTR